MQKQPRQKQPPKQLQKPLSKQLQTQPQKHTKKQPKKITASYLHNAGLYYLERYASSSGHFRSVMIRKIRRSCHVHTDQNFEACAAMLEDVIASFVRSGLLNDGLYLESMVRNYRAKGLSRKMIVNKLAAKKISTADIEAALSSYDDTQGNSGLLTDHDNQTGSRIDTELKSAAIFCRKKKLGAYSASSANSAHQADDENESASTTAPQEDDNQMQKQLGKLARAGYSYDISQKVLSLSLDELIEIQG